MDTLTGIFETLEKDYENQNCEKELSGGNGASAHEAS